MFTSLKTLIVIAIFQLLILSVVIFRKQGQSFSRFMLITLFVTFALFLFGNLFLFIKSKPLYKFAHISDLTVFLLSPILYLYMLAKIDNKTTMDRRDLLHFVPFFMVAIAMGFLLYFHVKRIYITTSVYLLGGLFIQNAVYIYLTANKLKEKNIDLFSRQSLKKGIQKENWLRGLFVTFLLVVVFQLSIYVVCNVFRLIEVCIVVTGIFFIVTFLAINNIILFGLTDSPFFSDRDKYEGSRIEGYQREEYLQNILTALDNEKVYLDSLLTLDKLSKITRVPKNTLSQIINEHFQMSFNDLINQYRINEAKSIIGNGMQGVTIIDMAYRVGFNSKSTFNNAFKKNTNMTPSEYIVTNNKASIN